MPGTLFLVATPIGNLQDITLRALETLRSVDLIACEDTRHTRNLLNHFRISNRTVSYHEHNEQERAEELADRLMHGDSIAIVSDAGTPGICDPGFRIVQSAIEIGADSSFHSRCGCVRKRSRRIRHCNRFDLFRRLFAGQKRRAT